jgi:Zn finger protein HypA/HybF involved in hydrogenase expression
MHELSLVDELITECTRRAGGRPVDEVRINCAEGTDTDEVADAFAFLAPHCAAAGGPNPMAGARLAISSVAARGECKCGFADEVPADAVAGHMFVCPACGCVGDQTGVLELVALVFAGETGLGGAETG